MEKKKNIMMHKPSNKDKWVQKNLSHNSSDLIFTVSDYTDRAIESFYDFIAILRNGNSYHIVEGDHLENAIDLFNDDCSHDNFIEADYEILVCDNISDCKDI